MCVCVGGSIWSSILAISHALSLLLSGWRQQPMSSSGDSMKQRTPLRHAGMRSQMEISLLCLNAARFGGCDSDKNEQ